MSTLQIQLSETAQQILRQLAEKTGQSMSDVLDKALDAYRRKLLIEQPLDESWPETTIHLSPEAQLAFWKALNEPVRLTEAQKRLGAIMQGLSKAE
jgi:uncharacterized protein (DUF1778 family)